ncbi:hypothetical protein D9758_001527 [Tetrapyrgos nigripes]|uniref:Phosphatidylinositol-specific phospholipase C X domain-containing protein n=1 Tax=Tetrapyrgos nigripes TaxID=182062 RepID=A0A8H5GY57_9AGAR|nr:hypothetical protein D9758_001527 [Tetrapyrgos nigripes]
MQLTILNLTERSITCSLENPLTRLNVREQTQIRRKEFVALPSTPITTVLPKRCRHISLTHELNPNSCISSSGSPLDLQTEAKKEGGGADARISSTVKPTGLLTRISLTLSALWKILETAEESPWRVYVTKVARKHYKLSIFLKRNASSFLSEIPDSVPLYSLLLPGTHDTMAFYGWPISQCQFLSDPLSTQLHSGIRVIDIRLALVKGRLIAHHGIYPEKTPFSEILETLNEFLTSPLSNRETIVMSMKQEDASRTPPPLFSAAIHREIEESKGGFGLFFLENRIPKLGEVRGKVVMLSRFGGNGDGWEGGLEGLGIHPTTWPDSEKDAFEWDCKGVTVRTHDWYSIPSFLYIPEKFSLAAQNLLSPSDSTPTLSFSYFSAASFPFSMPPIIAQGFGWPKWGLGIEGVNSRLARWVLGGLSGEGPASANACERKGIFGNGGEPRIRGWAMMDYYSSPAEGLVPLLIECNFRGRKDGEEGWIC